VNVPYFWVIVAITLSAAGAFFVVPFTKNTIGGEAKTSNIVEADRLAMEKEEEVVKRAGVIGHGKVAYYEASDQGAKSVFTVWFPWSLAGILFSITMTRMTQKNEQMNINGTYYHPTFLYESLWSLLGFVLIVTIRNRKIVFASRRSRFELRFVVLSGSVLH